MVSCYDTPENPFYRQYGYIENIAEQDRNRLSGYLRHVFRGVPEHSIHENAEVRLLGSQREIVATHTEEGNKFKDVFHRVDMGHLPGVCGFGRRSHLWDLWCKLTPDNNYFTQQNGPACFPEGEGQVVERHFVVDNTFFDTAAQWIVDEWVDIHISTDSFRRDLNYSMGLFLALGLNALLNH